MDDEDIFNYSTILVCLYLQNQRFPGELHPQSLPQILKLMRSGSPSRSSLFERLASGSHSLNTSRLERRGLLEWGENLVRSKRALSIFDPEYPRRLLQRFGEVAPAAIWKSGLIRDLPILGILTLDDFTHARRDLGFEVLSRMKGLPYQSGVLGYFESGGWLGNAALELGIEVVRFSSEANPRIQELSQLCITEPSGNPSEADIRRQIQLLFDCSERVLILSGDARTPTYRKWLQTIISTSRTPLYYYEHTQSGAKFFGARSQGISHPGEFVEGVSHLLSGSTSYTRTA